MRFRRHFPDKFSPGRKDKRVNEARAMLSGLTGEKLATTQPHSIACLFNLKDATAETIIQAEMLKRSANV